MFAANLLPPAPAHGPGGRLLDGGGVAAHDSGIGLVRLAGVRAEPEKLQAPLRAGGAGGRPRGVCVCVSGVICK